MTHTRRTGVLAAAAAFMIATATMTGCDLLGGDTDQPNPAPERKMTRPRNENTDMKSSQNPQGVSYSRQMNAKMMSTAAKARRTCLANDDVDKATVVMVPGTKTALCGVDLQNNLDSGEVRKALREVKQDCQALPGVNKCYVSADPNMFTRIKRIADETADGKPLTGLSRQINQVLNRLAPQ